MNINSRQFVIGLRTAEKIRQCIRSNVLRRQRPLDSRGRGRICVHELNLLQYFIYEIC
jgi:hypothetical protein